MMECSQVLNIIDIYVLPLTVCRQCPCQTRAWGGVGQAQILGDGAHRHLRGVGIRQLSLDQPTFTCW